MAAAKEALVLEPHNDDFVIGMGGTGLQLLDSGWHVSSVVMTDGRYGDRDRDPEDVKRIRAEEKAAEAAFLGIDYVELGVEDTQLAAAYRDEAARADVRDRLVEQLEAVHPTAVFFPAPAEAHPDHEATYAFARDAIEAATVDPIPAEYLVWRVPFRAATFEAVEEVVKSEMAPEEPRKLEAIRLHKSQERKREYTSLVSAFNAYLSYLYYDEATSGAAELLGLECSEEAARPLLADLRATVVTDRFPERVSLTGGAEPSTVNR